MLQTAYEITRVLDLCRLKNITWNENKKSLRDTILQRNICFCAQKIAIQYNETLLQQLEQEQQLELQQLQLQPVQEETEETKEDIQSDNLFDIQSDNVFEFDSQSDNMFEFNIQSENMFEVDIQSKNLFDIQSENLVDIQSENLVDIQSEDLLVDQYIRYNIMDILPNTVLCHDIWENFSYNIDSSLYNIWQSSYDSQIIYDSIWSD